MIELPSVTTEMFKPQGRSRETDAAFGAIVRHLYGPDGDEFIGGVREGSLGADARHEYKGRINQYFFSAFKGVFGFPDTVTPESFYNDAGKTASKIVTDLAAMTGISISQDPFVDEINPHAPSPTDLLYHLARLDDGRDIDIDFNVRRHFALLIINASNEAISGNGYVTDILSDIQFSLNKRLYFGGEDGYHEMYHPFTYHDAQTNQFLDFAGKNPQPPTSDRRLLSHTLRARRIEDIGLVYTMRNSKQPEAATKKAIAKALKNGGKVKPNIDVEDHLRMTFVALEGNLPRRIREQTDQVDRVHTRVLELLEEYKGIKKIVPENEVAGDRGQANINRRLDKVYLYDTNVPLELVVLREPDFYDQRFEVGTVDPKTGLYRGQAHKLFEIRRDWPVAVVVLDEMIYGINVMFALATRSSQTAEELKHMNEVKKYSPVERLEDLELVVQNHSL